MKLSDETHLGITGVVDMHTCTQNPKDYDYNDLFQLLLNTVKHGFFVANFAFFFFKREKYMIAKMLMLIFYSFRPFSRILGFLGYLLSSVVSAFCRFAKNPCRENLYSAKREQFMRTKNPCFTIPSGPVL